MRWSARSRRRGPCSQAELRSPLFDPTCFRPGASAEAYSLREHVASADRGAAWLAARFGKKNFLITSIAGFTVASMLCGAAQNLEQMVVFRIIQGLGAGCIQSVATTIVG